jgi:hypothetical protein
MLKKDPEVLLLNEIASLTVYAFKKTRLSEVTCPP